VWEYNGAVYVINPQSLRAMPMGQFTRKVPCEMPRMRSIDLDTPLDWAIAEVVMAELTKK
jgi:N-acylneuraminate cytidylyltransferase